MQRPTIIATDDTIRHLVRNEIAKFGDTADLNHIDVFRVSDMSCMFEHSTFNGDISTWNVSNVVNMQYMFYRSAFCGDISKWNVLNVTNMHGMFAHSPFNGDIFTWNVSNVTTMQSMFQCSAFDRDVSKWDVSNVTNMQGMFSDSAFNGDISKWNMSDRVDVSFMFHRSALNSNIFDWIRHARWNVQRMLCKAQRYAALPLLRVDSIDAYRDTLNTMFRTSRHWATRDKKNVCISVHHGVLLLLLQEQEPKRIHPELRQEDSEKLQMLYQLTGSVYHSVNAWEKQRNHGIPMPDSILVFSPE